MKLVSRIKSLGMILIKIKILKTKNSLLAILLCFSLGNKIKIHNKNFHSQNKLFKAASSREATLMIKTTSIQISTYTTKVPR